MYKGASSGQSISTRPQLGSSCVRHAASPRPSAVHSSAWPSEPWHTSSAASLGPPPPPADRTAGHTSRRARDHRSTIGRCPSTSMASGSERHAAYAAGLSRCSSDFRRPSHEWRSISRSAASVVGAGSTQLSRSSSRVCFARLSGETYVRAIDRSLSPASAAPAARACAMPASVRTEASEEPWMMPSRL